MKHLTRLLRVPSDGGTWASGWIRGLDGNFARNSMENLRLMMTTHFPKFLQEQTPEAFENGRRTKKADWETAHETINANKVA